MKSILVIFGAALLALLATCAAAADPELRMHEEQPVRAPFCTDRADAVRIATADAQEGIVKAREVLKAAQTCGIAAALVTPRRVVYAGLTERGKTVRVVEVSVQGSTTTYYMIVDVKVVAAPIGAAT